MKRVLITGEEGYVGKSFANWLLQWPDKYQTSFLSVRDESWKLHDLSHYNVVVHAAAIVHRKEVPPEVYDRVNCQLTLNLATQAKTQGVRQFIFLSTMSVYGNAEGEITEETKISPNNHYGSSKYEAEIALNELADSNFRILIVRPPMVYGRNCPGNFASLVSIARKLPIFPKLTDQKRSMIFVDNLSSFLHYAVDCELAGLYFPQDPEHVNTSEMVSLIAQSHGKRMRTTRVFNPLLRLMRRVPLVKKAFGSLYYAKELPGLCSMNEEKYVVCNVKEAIEKSV